MEGLRSKLVVKNAPTLVYKDRMLKAVATTSDGRPLMILGLSQGNMDLLLQRKPIFIDTTAYGVKGGLQILILGGETEEAIQAELEKYTQLPEPSVDPAPHDQSVKLVEPTDSVKSEEPGDTFETCPACRYGNCFNPKHGW